MWCQMYKADYCLKHFKLVLIREKNDNVLTMSHYI